MMLRKKKTKPKYLRMGRINISKDLINESIEDLAFFRAIFSEFYPVHIGEFDVYTMTYVGFSDHFELTEEGKPIPEYSAEFEQTAGIVFLTKFTKTWPQESE